MWTITGAVVMPHLPSHGFCASREEGDGEVRRDLARVVGDPTLGARPSAGLPDAARETTPAVAPREDLKTHVPFAR
jgi:hypothetical protein